MATEDSQAKNCKGKNIVICCDGTGNEFIDQLDPDNNNSNVVKLYATLGIHNDQVGYYHPGVGTAADPRARSRIARWWSQTKGLAFAAGFKDNVFDAYRHLMEMYDDGDCVYLIGFSRGAYTVRALAGLLDGYGLLCKGNEGHLPYAWNGYVSQHDDRARNEVSHNQTFKKTFSHQDFRIHFVGIWDTVSSVGWINTPLRLFSVAQNPTVRIGRHAISIDERRCFYRDNLLEKATAAQLASVASEAEPHPEQDVLQVWFPGVHSDVGGSYPQNTSVLSDGALRWLIEEAEKAGADIKPHMKQLVLGEEVNPLPEGENERRRVEVLKGLFPKPTETEVHPSLRGPWWLLELLPHRYYDKDDGAENWRTPLGMRRRIPSGKVRMPNGQVIQQKTYVHHTARDLMKNGSYRPSNVVGGVESLKLTDVKGQEPGSLYSYEPPQDAKPTRNEAWVRWSVMIGVSAADLAVVGLMLTGAVVAVEGIWRVVRGK